MTDYYYPASQQYFFSDKHMKIIFDSYQVKNLQDLKIKLNSDFVPLNNSSLKDQKTIQEIIQLKIKNRMSLIHDIKLSPTMAIDVTNGKISIDSIFETRKEKFFLTWVGQKLICEGCGHQHFSSGNRTCYTVECQCQISEVQI